MARVITACVVDQCAGSSGVPGTARGMCRGHYQKWQKYGDPLEDRRPVRKMCTIGDCGKLCVGRGLCAAHWYHWKRHGDPGRRKNGQIVDGLRVCSRCREDKPLAEYGSCKATNSGYGTYCKVCARELTAARRAANPDYVPPPPDREKQRRYAKARRDSHPLYFELYRERTREWMRAYSKEYRKRNPEAVKTHATRRRARRYNAYVEPVRPRAVYERDGWTCGICHDAIDPAVAHPDPMSASVDHIVPLARHGKHSMANVQAAHLICNMRKGSKTLIGIQCQGV